MFHVKRQFQKVKYLILLSNLDKTFHVKRPFPAENDP